MYPVDEKMKDQLITFSFLACLLIPPAAVANYVEVHFTAQVTETNVDQKKPGDIINGSYKYDLHGKERSYNWGTGWFSTFYPRAFPTSIVIDGIQLFGPDPLTFASTDISEYSFYFPDRSLRHRDVALISEGHTRDGKELKEHYIYLSQTKTDVGFSGLAMLVDPSALEDALIVVSKNIGNSLEPQYSGKIIGAIAIEHEEVPDIVFLNSPYGAVIYSYGRLQKSNNLIDWEDQTERDSALFPDGAKAVFYRAVE